MTTPTPPQERPDWAYVSQNGTEVFGIQVYRDGALADADGNAVTVTLTTEDGATRIFQRNADHPGAGQYSVTLGAGDTSMSGHYALRFDWAVNGVADLYVWPVYVGPAAPAYDMLPPDAKAVVENVLVKFADLYDSPYGGPHLQVYLQTKFGRGRIAQLMRTALQKLNTSAQPVTSYDYTNFPFAEWGGLIEQATYLEVIRHLIRTYTEQPEVILGTAVSRTDRTAYADKWRAILGDESGEEYRNMLANWKMSNMFLGKPSVLVSGGAYGRWGPIPFPGGAGEAAARGYFVSRGYW